MTERYLAELQPACRLIVDEMPPYATKVWLISAYGRGFSGEYYRECNAVAWAPLPKLSAEQKARIAQLQKDGVDCTRRIDDSQQD